MANPGDLPIVVPMLASAARDLPGREEEWASEIKWDGARALAFVAGGEVVIRSRSGRDVTSTYPEVAADLAAASGGRSLILDAEIAAFEGNRPRFELLQRRLHVGRPSLTLITAVPVTFLAFDLLHHEGRSLLRNPYLRRRALLEALGLETGSVLVPPAFAGEIRSVADASRDLGLEGVMLKRLGSTYSPGRRSADWLKVRHVLAADVRIGGWMPGSGRRSALAGSVLVGRPGSLGLEYVGQVGSGFAERELREITAVLREMEQDTSPFATPVPADVSRRARWSFPALTAEVGYVEITRSGRFRHAVWRGLRSSA
jgi:bifunctional non-homologous end joining protein LigD